MRAAAAKLQSCCKAAKLLKPHGAQARPPAGSRPWLHRWPAALAGLGLGLRRADPTSHTLQPPSLSLSSPHAARRTSPAFLPARLCFCFFLLCFQLSHIQKIPSCRRAATSPHAPVLPCLACFFTSLCHSGVSRLHHGHRLRQETKRATLARSRLTASCACVASSALRLPPPLSALCGPPSTLR